MNMRSGQAARLTNLGYLMNTEDSPDAELLSAVEEFQCDEELAVDGISGPKTQNQLVKVHGC